MGRGRELHGGGNGSEMPEEVEKKSKATERSWGKGGGAVGGGRMELSETKTKCPAAT